MHKILAFSSVDRIFYPQKHFNFFLFIIIYLFIYLIYFLLIYLFIYLLILYLFQWQQNIRRPIFHFLLTLCVRVSAISPFVRRRVSMYFSSFRMFVSFCVSEYVCLFVCLFGCYPGPVIVCAKCLYCYYQFWFLDTTVIFITHHF